MEAVILQAFKPSEGADSDCSDESIDEKIQELCKIPIENKVTQDYSISVAKRKRNGEMRLPTRRPNPNIDNRNAILARENRRRKKEHLEATQKELDNWKKINRSLFKALRQQVKANRKLETERNYYRNIISNRSEIVKFLSIYNTPISSNLQSKPSPPHADWMETPNRSENRSTGRDSCISNIHNFDMDYSGSSIDKMLFDSSFNAHFKPFENISTDMESSTTCNEIWSELIEHDLGLSCDYKSRSKQQDASNNLSDLLKSAIDDHTYTFSESSTNSVNFSPHAFEDETAKFLPNWYWNSISVEPPTELLQPESFST